MKTKSPTVALMASFIHYTLPESTLPGPGEDDSEGDPAWDSGARSCGAGGGSEQSQRHPSTPRGGPAARLPAAGSSPAPGARSPPRAAAVQTGSETGAALTHERGTGAAAGPP